MDWGKLLNAGLEIANTVAETQNKQIEGKDVAKQIDTATASGVVDDLLTDLVGRTDNNVDDALVSLVKGSFDFDNIDDLLIGYLESLAAKSNNNVDDHIVAFLKCYLTKCKG